MNLEEEQYSQLLKRSDIKAALLRIKKAEETRDSVSRKLCAESDSVTTMDLAHWESELRAAKAELMEISRHTPLLKRHPLLAA